MWIYFKSAQIIQEKNFSWHFLEFEGLCVLWVSSF